MTVLALGSCQSLGPGAFALATATPDSPSPVTSFGRGGADPGDRSPLFTDPPDPTYFKTPNSTPRSGPAWTLPDCLDSTVAVEGLTGSKLLTQSSSLIVIGEFQGYGPGNWDTPDGQRPTSQQYRDARYDLTIVRDLHIAPETLLRGSSADVADAYVRGGTSGCDTIRYDNMDDLSPGSRHVFFLDQFPFGIVESVREQLLCSWAIDPNDVITDDMLGKLTLSDLIKVVQSTPYDRKLPGWAFGISNVC